MFRMDWLRRFLEPSSSRKDRRRLTARSRKPIRLRLESLEERLTPSGGNPTVTQTAGSYSALTTAVAADTAANTNYVIQITNSFTLDSGGQVSISKLGTGSTLTIEGQNGSNYTLTGNGNRLFTVAFGQNVAFDNLTLTGGSGVSSGGAIDDQGGNVTLSAVAVRGNKVSANEAFGGGLFVTQSGILTIQGGSTIQSNQATGTGNFITAKGAKTANDALGGGLYASIGSTVILQDSSIGNNTVSANQAFGGGLCVGNSTLTIQDGSTIQSNRASGTGTYAATYVVNSSGLASGGGLYVYGTSSVQITDSSLDKNIAQGGQGADGTAAGASGNGGGLAQGGGVYIGGSGWNATLIGDTLSGNAAIGGNGGNGAAGSNATAPNTSGGNGGAGGNGGDAWGGAAYFSSSGSNRLTILNDPSAPSIDPSTWIGNSVQGGAGGNGGAGGTSTGTASDSAGGLLGQGGNAFGGALYVTSSTAASVNIGNSAFYANKATGGNDGTIGLSGTGGQSQSAPVPLVPGGDAVGGGLALSGDNITIVNSTVAANTVTGGLGNYGYQGSVWGGGISFDGDSILNPPSQSSTPPAPIFINNTITQNTTNGPGVNGDGGTGSFGSGIFVGSISATLINNLIQGNQGIGAYAPDVSGGPVSLSNASNNFIGTMSPNTVSTTTNIVGNPQVQLGSVVGVDANGNPTGGPIYYPLLSGTVSIGAGTTSVMDTIASVEGTTSANATDEIGNPRSTNGSINLGAVQTVIPVSSYALIVTDNPADQTVYAGSTVSFTASASGNPMPAVQWQVSTDGGTTWSNISGATSTTLTLSNVSVAMSGNEYQAIFSNSSGNVTSAAATLTVNAAGATIALSPSTLPNAAVGAAYNQSITASGGSGTLTMTYRITSGSLPRGLNITTSGGTLTISGMPTATGTVSFTVTASDSDGDTTTQSYSLTVNAAGAGGGSGTLNVPPLLAFFDRLLGGTETVNANGTETIADSLFGFPLLVSTFDAQGNLESVTLFGFTIPNWVWEL